MDTSPTPPVAPPNKNTDSSATVTPDAATTSASTAPPSPNHPTPPVTSEAIAQPEDDTNDNASNKTRRWFIRLPKKPTKTKKSTSPVLVDEAVLLRKEEATFKRKIDRMDALLKGGRTPSAVQGKHLYLAGKKLTRPTALSNRDLSYARFRGADLRKQDFGKANVTDADFRDADLSDADLLLVVGLQAHRLSGADLNRCKLPPEIEKFPALSNVTTLSQNAGKMFLTTLLACVFVLLTTASTADIQLLTNSGTAQLPVLNIGVSTQYFFFIAPFVLLILSVTTHLYLQRLWEAMAQLPAVFPDGESVDNKTYPWLVNDLVRTGFPLLARKQHNTPLAWMQLKAFSLIAYGTVPVALWIVFLRCLARHDPLLSGWLTLIFALAVAWAYLVSYLNRITLRRLSEEKAAFLRRDFRTLRRPALFLAGSLLYGFVFTLYACKGTPLILSTLQRNQVRRWSTAQPIEESMKRMEDARKAIKTALTALPDSSRSKKVETQREELIKAQEELDKSEKELTAVVTTFYTSSPIALWSNYAEQPWGIPIPAFSPGKIVEDTSQMTDKWKPKDAVYPTPYLPQAANLGDAQIGNVNQQGYFIIQDDLFPTQTESEKAEAHEVQVREWQEQLGSMVKRISFQGMNLRFLHARSAFLVNADFRRADMTGADFTNADLRNAVFYAGFGTPIELSFASLIDAKLDGADLRGATLNGASIRRATLNGAYLSFATLNGADLSGATLNGADLYSASLIGANLSDAKLIGANLRGATLIGADLRGATLTHAYYEATHSPFAPDNNPPKGWHTSPLSPKDKRIYGQTGYVELVPKVPDKD